MFAHQVGTFDDGAHLFRIDGENAAGLALVVAGVDEDHVALLDV